MTHTQEILTIAICVAGTMATRFLPFLIFREGRPVNCSEGCPPKRACDASVAPNVFFSELNASASTPNFKSPNINGTNMISPFSCFF